ncbi:hypothetical protein [Wukongibacter sp. M2B1]
MKCRQFYYIISDFDNNEIFSCGAEFSDFIKFISHKLELKRNNGREIR